MTEARLRELRRLVRAGELPPDLLDVLQAVSVRLARLRLLPPSFAPYGHWDDEAAGEIFAAWYAERLLGQGHLQALLDRARTPGAFRRLAERSLRQHLLAAQDRNQAHNLFKRLLALLDEDPRFALAIDASRPQDRWYSLAGGGAEPWMGGERELAAHAWALGDFAVIRYRASAAKLSPVLGFDELARFVAGLLERLDAALSTAVVMRVLSLRFGLGEARLDSLEDAGEAPELAHRGEDDELLLRDTARQILATLSARQAAVLRATVSEYPIAAIATDLGISAGTVSNDQRRIGELVARFSAGDHERGRLLNILADLLYMEDDD
jgi:hypothetical protein